MSVDPDTLIHNMPMTNYRKWVKLFVTYGQSEDHELMLQLLGDYIIIASDTVAERQADVNEWARKAKGQSMTNFTKKHCRDQLRLAQKHLNGTNRQLDRYQTMYDLLKELVP
jgi:hypothetical protein